MPGLGKVTKVSARACYTLALLSSRTAVAWAKTATAIWASVTTAGNPSYKPVAISSLSEVTALSAGEFFAMALLESGGVRSWGSDSGGALGNGDSSGSAVP